VLEVLYHRAKFGGARTLPATGAAKNVAFFICLFVCLSLGCRGYGDSHRGSHGYGYGMGMGTMRNTHGISEWM